MKVLEAMAFGFILGLLVMSFVASKKLGRMIETGQIPYNDRWYTVQEEQ